MQKCVLAQQQIQIPNGYGPPSSGLDGQTPPPPAPSAINIDSSTNPLYQQPTQQQEMDGLVGMSQNQQHYQPPPGSSQHSTGSTGSSTSTGHAQSFTGPAFVYVPPPNLQGPPHSMSNGQPQIPGNGSNSWGLREFVQHSVFAAPPSPSFGAGTGSQQQPNSGTMTPNSITPRASFPSNLPAQPYLESPATSGTTTPHSGSTPRALTPPVAPLPAGALPTSSQQSHQQPPSYPTGVDANLLYTLTSMTEEQLREAWEQDLQAQMAQMERVRRNVAIRDPGI
eukprot:TRINITY_DN52709_c0_g1_i1.p2 TRINITY_DN52709_c0_g1~~TRINITY_DN52709_c0_g1_i1.p2  ORF type:complete len:293 (-),score=62.08 TRINITY_DN52709_c0_g1_i1:1324-2166(-)